MDIITALQLSIGDAEYWARQLRNAIGDTHAEQAQALRELLNQLEEQNV